MAKILVLPPSLLLYCFLVCLINKLLSYDSTNCREAGVVWFLSPIVLFEADPPPLPRGRLLTNLYYADNMEAFLLCLYF